MTLFVDYFITGMPDGSILLDEELKADRLKIENGDKFIAIVKDEKVFLKKVNVDARTEPARSD